MVSTCQTDKASWYILSRKASEDAETVDFTHQLMPTILAAMFDPVRLIDIYQAARLPKPADVTVLIIVSDLSKMVFCVS